MDIEKIKAESVGRWHGIFSALGIEVGEGRHTACPVCGGKDRFRFDDKDGRGTWYCNQCGAGDGVKLVMDVLKCSFRDALVDVGRVVGVAEKLNTPAEPTITRERMREIFVNSRPASEDNPAGRYLLNRGLTVIPKTLRYLEKCWCSERKQECPAMLAVFSSPVGEAVTMHRTYITMSGGKAPIKKVKKMLPALKGLTGGAIRLFPAGEMLAIAEGIETAIAVHEDTQLPCWAAFSAAMLAKFEPPGIVKHVAIFADNDQNYTGQSAAYQLANRLAIKGLEVDVYVPHLDGEDWLDVHNKQVKHG